MPKSTPKPNRDALQQVEVRSRRELRRWLECNYAQSESVWLVTFKKAAGSLNVPWAELEEEALYFGWIDSVPRRLDAERSMILLSPRKPGSAWSAINKLKVARLTATGQMTPAGLAKVDAAKAEGSSSFLDDVEA